MAKRKKLNIRILEQVLSAVKNNKLLSLRIYTSNYGKNKGTLMIEYSISKNTIESNIADYPSIIRAISSIQKAFINKKIDSLQFDFNYKEKAFVYRIINKE